MDRHDLPTTNQPAADPSADRHAVVIFDGVCNLCNAAVNFVLDRDPAGYFRFASNGSAVGRDMLMNCPPCDASGGMHGSLFDSVVLVERGRCYTKSDAGLRIARRLRFPWPLLAVLLVVVPSDLRDAVYDLIARNRYRWFGRRDEPSSADAACRMPTPERVRRFLA